MSEVSLYCCKEPVLIATKLLTTFTNELVHEFRSASDIYNDQKGIPLVNAFIQDGEETFVLSAVSFVCLTDLRSEFSP